MPGRADNRSGAREKDSFLYLPLFKSNERSEYSYIGLADFFSGKRFKFCSRSVLIFRGLTCDYFLSSVHFYCLRQAPLSNSKIVMVTRNVIDSKFENGNQLSDFPAK